MDLTDPDAHAFALKQLATYCPPDDEDRCSEWLGSTPAPNFRGLIHFPKPLYRAGRSPRVSLAYRVRWHLEVAPIPPGAHICHTCDNPRCVRLDHLFIGNPAINSRDKLDKGRGTGRTYPVTVRQDAVCEWASGRWPSKSALARHLGMPAATLIKWTNDAYPSFPDFVAHREELYRRTSVPVVVGVAS